LVATFLLLADVCFSRDVVVSVGDGECIYLWRVLDTNTNGHSLDNPADIKMIEAEQPATVTLRSWANGSAPRPHSSGAAVGTGKLLAILAQREVLGCSGVFIGSCTMTFAWGVPLIYL
jgi:hypothetical protein